MHFKRFPENAKSPAVMLGFFYGRSTGIVFVGCSLLANGGAQRDLPQAKIRLQACLQQGKRQGLSLSETACWRMMALNVTCFRQRFACRQAPTKTGNVKLVGTGLPAILSVRTFPLTGANRQQACLLQR